MDYKEIGNSGIKVSSICLGTMNFSNPVSNQDSIKMLHWSLDHGINFIDTADIYEGYDRFMGSPGGKAESIIGKGLKGKRNQAIITTKVGNHVGKTEYEGMGLGKNHITHQINASLKRMKTDYVDIYELHKADPETPLIETLSVIDQLIESGKVRVWGFSNFDTNQIHEMVTICKENGWDLPVINQALYNWLIRDIEESQLTTCLEYNISITPYRPLEGGLLTGKYKRGKTPPPNTRAAENPSSLNVDELSNDFYKKLDGFELEASNSELSPAKYAIKWLLDKPGICSVVIGGKTLEQLNEFLT